MADNNRYKARVSEGLDSSDEDVGAPYPCGFYKVLIVSKGNRWKLWKGAICPTTNQLLSTERWSWSYT